jgi:hypothetical protein
MFDKYCNTVKPWSVELVKTQHIASPATALNFEDRD